MRLWDREGHQIRAFEGNQAGIHNIAISPNQKLLVTGGQDSSVRVWEIASGHLRAVYRVNSMVRSVAFSPDGHSFAAGGFETAHVWNLDEMPAPPADDSMLAAWLDGLTTAIVGSDSVVATPTAPNR
jgi:WD40 repeat protein